MFESKYYLDLANNNPDKFDKLLHMISDMHERLKFYCEDDYYHFLTKMHCAVFGPHFDEKTAKMAVANLCNADGTVGGHWTVDEVKAVATQYKVDFSYDFYYTLNMLYSVYCKSINVDVVVYLRMADAYINDANWGDGKPFIAWIAQMRASDK